VRMSAQQALPKSFRTLCKERFASKRALTPEVAAPWPCRPRFTLLHAVLKRQPRQAAAVRV
jgi:hypothetical protein